MASYGQALREKTIAEALACIGCNECMLACPLPETGTVTIALLNDAVLSARVDRAEVREFAQSCTQCQQCVPVCPADLSRADMVLWNKVRVLDEEPDRALRIQVGSDVRTLPGWTLDRLSGELAMLPLFAATERAALRRAVLAGTLRKLVPGELLFRAGTWHDRLWVVVDGLVEHVQELPRPGQAPEWLPLVSFGPGSFCGEQAVLGDRPEAHDVRARETSVVLELPRFTVLRLCEESPAFHAQLRASYESHGIGYLVQRAGALEGLTLREREQVAAEGTLRTLTPGHVIVHGGRQSPDAAYLVLSGFLRVTQKSGGGGILPSDAGRVLVYLAEGDLFGVQAVLQRNQSLGRTVAAATRAEVLEIPGETLRTIIEAARRGGRPTLAAEMRARAVALETVSYRPMPKAEQSPPQPKKDSPLQPASSRLLGKELEMATVLQGRELLVIDQRRCVDCDNCVDACGRRHGRSRLVRSGPMLDGDLLLPSACRHCEDPVCLLCSVGGIVRLSDGQIQIVEDACIGCGACAHRCPYDNIRMYPRSAPPPRATGVKGLAFDVWDWIRGEKPEDDRIDNVRGEDAVAVKCDLCVGHGDYACVTACPTGAAFRIGNPATLVRLAAERDQGT